MSGLLSEVMEGLGGGMVRKNNRDCKRILLLDDLE